MTRAEELYTGEAGAKYWERNEEQLDTSAFDRMAALRQLLPNVARESWLEIGCGRGHNLGDGDVGLDCDPRQLAHLINAIPIVGHAYDLSMFITGSFPVVFSVGCLMHLPSWPTDDWRVTPHTGWQTAVEEMARVSSRYVILGEYWAEEERAIDSPNWPGCLWARPYTVPGYTEIKRIQPLAPFDAGVTFSVWEKS